MQENPEYSDVVNDVRASLRDYTARGNRAGVPRIWIDPGIGFGKTTNHNLNLLRDLKNMTSLGPELVIGVSRKRFVGQIHALSDQLPTGETVKVVDRLEGSVFTAMWSWWQGAHIVRVHDVRATAAAARLINKFQPTT